MRAFTAWLLQQHRAVNVRNLRISLAYWGCEDDDDVIELHTMLATSIAACGGLCDLHVEVDPNLRLTAIALHQLRRLHISCDSTASITVSLHHLTNLEHLWLEAQGVYIEPEARLPSSITRLHMDGWAGDSLPTQMAALTGLQSFSLQCTDYSRSEGFSLLTRLPNLQRLYLRDTAFPACLSQLTQLVALSFVDGIPTWDSSSFDLLAAALPQLRQLTHLAVTGSGDRWSAVQPVPVLLTQLQSLWWLGRYTAAPVLPASLPNLRRCGATAEQLAGSPPTVCQQWQVLELYLGWDALTSSAGCHQRSATISHAIRWATNNCPNLLQLVLRAKEETYYGHAFQAALEAQRRFPALLILRDPYDSTVPVDLLELCFETTNITSN